MAEDSAEMVMLKDIKDDTKELRLDVKRLDEAVRGNGQPGLNTRVALLENHATQAPPATSSPAAPTHRKKKIGAIVTGVGTVIATAAYALIQLYQQIFPAGPPQ